MANYRPIPTLTPEQEDRFWSRVDVPDQPSCCWEWTGNNCKGYGRFRIGDDNFLAHRIAYCLLLGQPRIDLGLDHLCRNPACLNPDHLRQLSISENSRIGFSLPARNARKTHCIHGHELFGSNLFIRPQGYRDCRVCRYERKRRYNERNRKRVAA